MKQILPTKEELIVYFKRTAGRYIHAGEILDSFANKSNYNFTEEERDHLMKLLHELKGDGYLLIQNEGSGLYDEKFSSTPDRILKFQKRHLNQIKKVGIFLGSQSWGLFIGVLITVLGLLALKYLRLQ